MDVTPVFTLEVQTGNSLDAILFYLDRLIY